MSKDWSKIYNNKKFFYKFFKMPKSFYDSQFGMFSILISK